MNCVFSKIEKTYKKRIPYRVIQLAAADPVPDPVRDPVAGPVQDGGWWEITILREENISPRNFDVSEFSIKK